MQAPAPERVGAGFFGDKTKMHITLLGLGSLVIQDEGVGVHAVRYIQEDYETLGLEIIDGGTCGMDLLPYLENWERLLVVDAVNFNKEPGYIGVLRNEEIPSLFGTKASLHHLGLMDVLATAQLLDISPKASWASSPRSWPWV
jgi:hydrogenase maturation protease